MSSATLRIVLSGQRQAIAGIVATKDAITGLNERVKEYGATAEVASKRSALMTQAIYMMRRMAYFGTLALVGAGVEALKWGVSFNQTMQSASIALKPVMANMGAVRGELEKLFNISKYSPFRFQDMTVAFRSMYLAMQPLGISVATVNTTLQSMTDALAATGRTSPANLNRVSVALQHMAYQGRLTGFTVNQLARDGIPIFAALSKEMGLTGDQLHNISKLGIPAQTVLDAINKYIETTPAYMNAAKRQAQSLQGELTTLKDNISQTMGALTFGGFAGVTGKNGILQNINNMFDGISKIILRQKGRISLAQVFGAVQTSWPWAAPFLTLIQNIIKEIKTLWLIIKNGLLPTLAILVSAANIWFNALRPLLWAIKEISKHSLLLVPILMTLAGLWTADAILTRASSLAAEWKVFWTTMEERSLYQMTVAQRLYIYYTVLATNVTRIWGIFMGRIWIKQGAGAFVALTGMEKMVRKLGIAIRTQLIPAIRAAGAAMLTAFIEGGPIVWIIAAVILLTAGLVILYFKWKWFHDLVNSTFTWIWQHWKLVAAILILIAPMLSIMLVTARLVYDHWHSLNKLLTDMWNNTLKPLFRWLQDIWNIMVTGPFTTAWNNINDMIKSITGWFQPMIRWADKAIAKIKELLGLWKKIPGATWIVGAVKGVASAVGGVASAAWNQKGVGRPDVSGGGAITTPQAQISPFNAAASAKPVKIEQHIHVHLDGKEIAANSAKHRQKAIARSGTRLINQ
jgi:tape measure domain-containing protein